MMRLGRSRTAAAASTSRLQVLRGGLARRSARAPSFVAARGFSAAAGTDLPTEADVVVIGGGSIGTSVLYHLKKAGVHAVLLERHQLTAGTTWHSAGMLWRLRPSDADIELNAYSRMMCKKLEEETGIESWTENGGLFVATNAERLAEYRRFSETGKFFGIDSHVLSPAEVKEVHPLLNVDDVYGGVYSPGDGTIDPTSITNAYAKAARGLGGRIFESTSVAGIETESYITAGGAEARRILAVNTSCGTRIMTSTVVNACGAWANAVAAMVGVDIPLKAMKHAMVLTEPIDGMHSGLPNVRDHDLSVYLKTQGDSMALGGYEQNPEFWPDVDPAFAFGLFELDFDTFGQNLEGHMTRCPIIEETGIKSTVCGPESFTPDHKPLMGPQPGVRGFYNACGFNSMGLMLGGGVGRELATWITTGSPEVDLFGFDCARFHPETVSDAKWVRDRTHESYAKTYSIVFPHDEPLAGRNARCSPIHDELVSRGCVHQARHGFERPGWFAVGLTDQAPKPYDYYGAYAEGACRLGEADQQDTPAHREHRYLDLVEGNLTFGWPASDAAVEEECRAAREGVAIFDQSYFGKFFVSGAEADAAMQYLCGADLEGKAVGSVTYTPLCNARGGVEADLTVTRLDAARHGGSSWYIAAGGNTVTKDFEWIDKVFDDRGFKAKVEDRSSSMAMISVQGPHSRKLLQPLVSSGHSLDDDAFAFSTCQHIEIAGHLLMCLRLTFVGELGFELHVPAEGAVEVYRAIRQAGEQYSHDHGVPVRDGGYRAIDSMSAEKNFRHWHADLCNRDTPMEAGIGFTVLSKLKRTGPDAADFLGRDALEAKRAAGLQRRLVCLVLDSEDVPLHGAETIWRNGECVGFVRSTAFGHTIGRSIAYGYVELSQMEASSQDDLTRDALPGETPPPEEALSQDRLVDRAWRGETLLPREAKVAKITNKWLEAGRWQVGDKGELHEASLSLKAPFDPKNDRVKGIYAPEALFSMKSARSRVAPQATDTAAYFEDASSDPSSSRARV